MSLGVKVDWGPEPAEQDHGFVHWPKGECPRQLPEGGDPKIID